MKNGIDVSRHNGAIDWKKVKESGIDFAILRAGYGQYDNQKDERFEENYTNAKKAGIKLGAYIYSYAKTTEDAVKEADVFLKWLKGKTFEMPVFYDVEEKSQSEKGKTFVSQLIKNFCKKMESSGYFVGVYASKYWFENFIDDECKKKYTSWVAQWAKDNTYKGAYGIWQFSATGKVSGISSSVDLNKSYTDYPSIIVKDGFNGFKKSPSTEKPVSPPATKPAAKTYKAGTKIELKNTPIYISATTNRQAAKKTGIYYIYDGEEIRSRYRITSKPSLVGKKPIDQNVTGYIRKADIKQV